MAAVQANQRLVKFIVAAVLYFAWGVIQGALQAQGPIHEFLGQGPAGIILAAELHVNLLGWVSLLLVALVYYLVPILTNKPIAAPRLINWIFWVFVVAFTIEAVLMIAVGINAGNAFIAGTTGPQLDALMAPYMIAIGMLSIVCALIFLIFVIQILATVARKAS